MKISNVLAVFIAEWHVHVSAAGPFPPLRAAGFQFEEVSHIPSALWQAVAHYCSHWGFSFERLCSCCACLDEIVAFGFLIKCLCSLSPGCDNGLVYTGTGRGISKHLHVRARCVMLANCTEGERTYYTVVKFTPGVSFLFFLCCWFRWNEVHFSLSKSLCPMTKFYKCLKRQKKKKETKLPLTDKPV